MLFLNVLPFIIYNNSIVRFVMSLRVVCRVFSQHTLFLSVQCLSKFNMKLSRQFFLRKRICCSFSMHFLTLKWVHQVFIKCPLTMNVPYCPLYVMLIDYKIYFFPIAFFAFAYLTLCFVYAITTIYSQTVYDKSHVLRPVSTAR